MRGFRVWGSLAIMYLSAGLGFEAKMQTSLFSDQPATKRISETSDSFPNHPALLGDLCWPFIDFTGFTNFNLGPTWTTFPHSR